MIFRLASSLDEMEPRWLLPLHLPHQRPPSSKPILEDDKRSPSHAEGLFVSRRKSLGL